MQSVLAATVNISLYSLLVGLLIGYAGFTAIRANFFARLRK